MAKRLLDLTLASVGLLLLSPLLLAAAAGILLSSPGPVLYRARRVGRGGRLFVMHKFRTMGWEPQRGSVITARGDPRVFHWGALLRRLKIDELPQLFDVLRGEMSIVGPRPEDPKIVDRHYDAIGWETLCVRPGLASPGSLYYYTHGEAALAGEDPEDAYARHVLPVKLALDVEYVRHPSLWTDLKIVLRTAWVIAMMALGRRSFPEPPPKRAAAPEH